MHRIHSIKLTLFLLRVSIVHYNNNPEEPMFFTVPDKTKNHPILIVKFLGYIQTMIEKLSVVTDNYFLFDYYSSYVSI